LGFRFGVPPPIDGLKENPIDGLKENPIDGLKRELDILGLFGQRLYN
jgi:hypothetical protein